MVSTEQLYEIYLQHPVICTDTRKITSNCIFFALKGENFDGNSFAMQALEAGADFAVVDRGVGEDPRLLVVKDSLAALQDLARHHRQQLEIPVIGITGSNGKTTTKELLYAVLSQRYSTFATQGNLNNHIGVPLSVLSITSAHKMAIIEMGANHQKEIELLCSISQPSHGLITNIGKAHLEGFGGIEGVKIGKGELYAYLSQSEGIAFVNHDSHDLMGMSRKHGLNNVVFYGRGMDNYVSGELLTNEPFLQVAWQLGRVEIDDRQHMVNTRLTGAYNLDNILAAVSVGSLFGLRAEEINAGISGYEPNNNRSQITRTDNNTLICDYYNANPSSMAAALDNLQQLQAAQKVIVLGDMFELGEESPAEHAAIVKKALQIGAARCIFIGKDFLDQQEKGGSFYANTEDAYVAIKKQPVKGATVLVKGSRGMKLEKLIELL